MTIRRWLFLSFLVLLLLFGLNLLVYFISNQVRKSAIEDLTQALSRQIRISPIQNQLNNLKRHTTLLSQINAPTSAIAPDELRFLTGQLESIKKEIEGLPDPVDPRIQIEQNALITDYRELARLWRFFYENFGVHHADAILVLATQADPLSQRLSLALVAIQEGEKERARVATERLEEVTRRTNIITLLFFGLSMFLAILLAINLSGYLIQRLEELMEGTALIGRGDLTHRITLKTPDELGQVAQSFNEMTENLSIARARLTQVNQELEAFSSAVSHDLRAPLRRLNSFNDAFLKQYGDQLDEEGKRYILKTRSSVKQMEEIIEGLLMLSRVTRYELHYQQLNLREIAYPIAERLKEAHPNRKATFIIDDVKGALVVYGDQRLLTAALENLLNNAWKFTGKKENAQITLGHTLFNKQKTFFVRDNGAGFDMAYVSKLFGAFERLHSGAEFEGHGIGLVTVKRIIERHGGQIWAEGEVDHGATFYFTIPTIDPSRPEP